jgi:PAS domain S-box-containing protein
MERGQGGSAGSRLIAQKHRILSLWEQRVRAAVPTARDTDRPVLVNALPEFLDRLAAALATRSPESAPQEAAVAAEHGKQRAELTEYSLDQVISEYQLLRQVLAEVLASEGSVTTGERELIFEFILSAVREAASEFARCRDREKESAHLAVAEANSHLEGRVRERMAELRLAEERFRHFVESVKDYAIFTLDPGGKITTWNQGCIRMKQYSADEAIGKHFSMLYPEAGNRRDEPQGHLRSAAIEGRFRGEGVRVRKNGNHFLADVCITPIYEDGALVGFTKVVQDLTERNLLVQERDLSRSDADTLRVEAEYRERFVAALSHDLRSPLGAARTSAELIARAPEKTDNVRTWAHRISEAVARTDRMISDLLDASRLQAGERLPLECKDCDLRQIATEVCDDLASKHGSRFTIQTDGPTGAFASPDGLRRVLDNLLSNAVKYGDAGRTITVRVRRADERLLVAVHNFGAIIPVEEQANLFRPFHRTEIAQASGKSGWGLGLTLAKGIVEAHGGIIKVESYPKEGTTFTVDLPVDPRTSSDLNQLS